MSDNVTDFTFLQGVKVIDFTQFEAGPSCTEALAWLGAEVVKIENPNRGDPGRRLQPNKPDTDPYYFHMFNANKKSVAINLKSSEGLDLAKEMIRQADVMMENFAPGAIERMGLSYDVVKDIHPSIIYAQVKGFGEGSPFEKNLSFDMIAQACGGTFSVTGEMDGPPIRPGVTVGDTGTGMLMAITILGALYKRRESGEGHRLQVAMQDAMLHYMRVNFATQGRTGKAANPEHWDRLLTLIGRDDLIGDERYLTPADRVKNMPEVDDLIATWTSNQTKYDAMRIIGEAGIPAGAVLDTDELNNDVTFEERGVMQTMIHPVHDPFKMPGWPVRVDGKASRLQASPMIGEHTDQVISDWLGINGEAVTALKAEAAVA